MPADTPRDLDERLRLLEASMEIQEQILASLHAERIEAERLTESVSRLGDGAAALGQALLRVDRTQQSLTELGTELRAVEARTANKGEVATQIKSARRRLLVVGVALLITALIGATLIFYVRKENARETFANCQRSARTAAAVTSYLETVSANSQVPEIRESARNLVDNIFRPVRCEQP